MTSASRPSCDRTRALLSRKLDGALTELELRVAAAHTARCAGCQAFENQSRWFTEELRAASLVELPEPVTVSALRRRAPVRTIANVASAAALVVATIGGLTLTFDPPGGEQGAQALAFGPATDTGLGDPVLRQFRRDALRAGVLQILPKADLPNAVKPALPATDA
jgi:predicted anti-sigma-YlaC factor YlaD